MGFGVTRPEGAEVEITVENVAHHSWRGCLAAFVVGRALRRKRLLRFKQLAELWFWHTQIKRWLKWYQGEDLKGFPIKATGELKVTAYTPRENAILTYRNAVMDRYPSVLRIPTEYFVGKRVLDVGAGPLGLALAFRGTEVYGLDPLADEYEALGFPVRRYDSRYTSVASGAESIPFPDGFFDAVISVNAIDHVDSFPATAKEISRVLRPDGILRIQIHYHCPTIAEPRELNDALVMQHLGDLRVQKIFEGPWRSHLTSHTTTIWANES
jgi:SAM-dependent methyltransferase